MFQWTQAWPFAGTRKKKRKTGVSITCEVLEHKANRLVKSHIRWHQLKDSTGWTVCRMWWNGFSSHQRISFCWKLLADFEEKFVAFQSHVMGLHTMNNYILNETGSSSKIPVYFTTPSKYTIMLLGKICSNENIMQ